MEQHDGCRLTVVGSRDCHGNRVHRFVVLGSDGKPLPERDPAFRGTRIIRVTNTAHEAWSEYRNRLGGEA